MNMMMMMRVKMFEMGRLFLLALTTNDCLAVMHWFDGVAVCRTLWHTCNTMHVCFTFHAPPCMLQRTCVELLDLFVLMVCLLPDLVHIGQLSPSQVWRVHYRVGFHITISCSVVAVTVLLYRLLLSRLSFPSISQLNYQEIFKVA